MNKGQAKAKLQFLRHNNARRCPICGGKRALSIVEVPQSRPVDYGVLSACDCSSILYTRFERGK